MDGLKDDTSGHQGDGAPERCCLPRRAAHERRRVTETAHLSADAKGVQRKEHAGGKAKATEALVGGGQGDGRVEEGLIDGRGQRGRAQDGKHREGQQEAAVNQRRGAVQATGAHSSTSLLQLARKATAARDSASTPRGSRTNAAGE